MRKKIILRMILISSCRNTWYILKNKGTVACAFGKNGLTTIYNYMSNKKENFGHNVGDALSDGDFGTWCDQWDKA